MKNTHPVPVKIWLGYSLLVIIAAILPLVTGATLGNGWVRVLDFVLLYAMLALGLNIVVVERDVRGSVHDVCIFRPA